MISLDLSSTLTCANTRRLALAQALTMWIAALPRYAHAMRNEMEA